MPNDITARHIDAVRQDSASSESAKTLPNGVVLTTSVSRLFGCLKGTEVSDKDYQKYRDKKYG